MQSTQPAEEGAVSKWVCDGCGKTLHPSHLTRVGIGVHHYDRDKDRFGDGLLNCGLVRERKVEDERETSYRDL